MHKKTKQTIKIVLFIVFSILGIARLAGKNLDTKSIIISANLYKKDKNGIIIGANSISYQAQKPQALIFIHGFASTPRVFLDLINEIKNRPFQTLANESTLQGGMATETQCNHRSHEDSSIAATKPDSSTLDFFRNSTADANCCVDSVLESSCTDPYTAVLCSESPCTSLSAANFERSLLKFPTPPDIYAPLLPFNGRNLETLSKADDKITLSYLEKIITNFSKTYQKITIIGLSYGGAQLAKLVNDNKIPNNATIILYAPAFYIKSNNFLQRNFAKIYSYWRSYCDYKILGCSQPNYASADKTAEPQFAKQPDFPYLSIPALLSMFKFDLENRNLLRTINRKFNVIIAKDDNQITYEKIKNDCNLNYKNCTLYTFNSGRHLIHWGKNKQIFYKLLLDLSCI